MSINGHKTSCTRTMYLRKKEKNRYIISSLPLILSTRAFCSSLWGLRNSLRLVLFLFLALPPIACSLTNYIVLKFSSCICHLANCHLANCHLASNLWLMLFSVAVGGYVWPYNPRHRYGCKEGK